MGPSSLWTGRNPRLAPLHRLQGRHCSTAAAEAHRLLFSIVRPSVHLSIYPSLAVTGKFENLQRESQKKRHYWFRLISVNWQLPMWHWDVSDHCIIIIIAIIKSSSLSASTQNCHHYHHHHCHHQRFQHYHFCSHHHRHCHHHLHQCNCHHCHCHHHHRRRLRHHHHHHELLLRSYFQLDVKFRLRLWRNKSCFVLFVVAIFFSFSFPPSRTGSLTQIESLLVQTQLQWEHKYSYWLVKSRQTMQTKANQRRCWQGLFSLCFQS